MTSENKIPKGTVRSKNSKKSLSFSLKYSTYYRIKFLKMKASSRVILSTAVESYLISLISKLEKDFNVDSGEYKKFIKAMDKQEGKPCPKNCGGKKKIIFFKKDNEEKAFVGCTNHPKCSFSENIYR